MSKALDEVMAGSGRLTEVPEANGRYGSGTRMPITDVR